MRGLTKAAAFLLAPALARASSMSLDKSWTVVNLDIPPGNHDVDSLALRLNIQETDEICGPTRLLVNGHYLEQNEDGFGSGVVPVGEDILMTAHWLFSCVTSNNGPAAKLLRFTIDKLDGEPTSDIDFAMTFRQTSPAIVLELGGAAVTEPWVPIESAVEQHPAEEMPDPDDELEAQMHELEILRAQVDDLMELIHAKEMIIRERLGNQGDHGPPPPPPPPPIFIMLQDCNSVQCVVRALTDKVKHTAGHFYGGFFKPGHGPPPQHESEYGWGVSGGREPYRGDGGHHKPPGFPGNHSRPFPPPPPPPFCPPCDGPPPPPPPPPPPHHGPPPEDGERPPLHDGDRPVPPDHDDDLPPPPEDGEHSHLPGHGDDSPPPDHPPHAPVDEFPPPPPHHGDHGPPEHGEQPHPPHGEPPFDGPHDGKPGDNDFGVHHPPMESEMDEQPSPPDHEGHPPPPPHRHGPHGHGPHGPGGHHHPPPPPVFMSFGVAAIALALFSVIGLGYIHRRANRLNPESRHALHRSSGNQRSRRSPLQKAIRRVLARWTGEYDEEKQAMLRHRSDSEDSVTMEQEIARFREAAFMVEGLVAAEEGRTHRGMVHPAPPHHFYQYHHPHPHPHGPPPHGPPPHGPPPGLPPRGPPPPPGPPSPPGPPPPPRPPMIPEDAAPTEYPDFVTGNERLPSYDDETHDASVVSDGCRSMPGSADYSPSTTASTTSDLLGDSKH